ARVVSAGTTQVEEEYSAADVWPPLDRRTEAIARRPGNKYHMRRLDVGKPRCAQKRVRIEGWLPGTLRIREVDVHICGDRKALVFRHLQPAAPRKRASHRRKFTYRMHRVNQIYS